MIVNVMSEFVRKPVSRCRLAEAFERACPVFAQWCDDPDNRLSRRELLEQFEGAWRSLLQVPVPDVSAATQPGPISYSMKPAATIFRMNFTLQPMDAGGPHAQLRLKVCCRAGGAGHCSVSAAIADAGANKFSVFYQGTLNAELTARST